MSALVRRFGAAAVLVAVLVACPSAKAQRRPIMVPPIAAYGVNPLWQIAPGMNLPQWNYNMAVMGNGFAQLPPQAFGYNPLLTAGNGMPIGPYMASLYGGFGGFGGYGGYGGLGGYGGYGGYGGGGYGYLGPYASTFNPYTGYLSGAAGVTNANADYWIKMQQGKLLRQEAVQKSIETRRKIIEEALWEQQQRPKTEEVRQKLLTEALDEARKDPRLQDIWSARTLNVLLRHLIAQQGRGEKGPNVALTEDLMRSINLTPGDSRANLGLLKNGGELQWPLVLQDADFKDAREGLNKRIAQAVQILKFNKTLPPGVVDDMRRDLDVLNNQLLVSVNTISPAQYIEAKRYLNLLGDAVRALSDPKVANYFNQNWIPQAKTVGELVKFMADNGLQFAPATPDDKPAYRALYHALAAYDAGMTRVARTENK
jgi:hypothetical protein